MSKRIIASILFSAFGLIGTSGFALADTIVRYATTMSTFYGVSITLAWA